MNRRHVAFGLAALPLGACARSEADAQAGPAAAMAASDFYVCQGCEGAIERAAAGLASAARLGREGEPGEPLRLQGAVYRPDGRTPASDVVVYAYHTNPAGLYAEGDGATEETRRHGRLRGWVRTGADGRYRFETIKPGVYPDRRGPAHVHLTLVEPGRRPYWIDSSVFEGEFGVTPAYVAGRDRRGGSGVVRLRSDAGVLVAERDIRLERHPA